MSNIELAKADALLSQSKLLIDKHETMVKEAGSLFNIFSILNMERLEVQTHSAFIYELLNPKGSHGQGNLYLKLFIKDVLKLEDFDVKAVKVERERAIGDLGRIDLVIENEVELIIIEMKVYASDVKKQLIRYDEYGKKSGKLHHIYYLTLNGDPASETSVGKAGNVKYKCISFRHDILMWIDACIGSGKTPLLPVLRESLYQYSNLVKKITNQMDGGLRMDFKDLLLKGDNLKIAAQLAEAIPYARADLEYRFWKELADSYDKRVEKLGAKPIEDDFLQDYNRAIEDIVDVRRKRSSYIFFQYAISINDALDLIFEFGNNGYDPKIYVALGLYDEHKEECFIPCEKYNKTFIELLESLGFTNTGSLKYRYLNYDLNFHDNSMLKLADETVLKEAVTSIGDELVEIIKLVIRNKQIKSLDKKSCLK